MSAESVQRNLHYSGSIDANQHNGYMVIQVWIKHKMTQLYLECFESDSLPQQNHAEIRINPLSANSTIWSNTIKQFAADKLFECVWPFCRVGAERIKTFRRKYILYADFPNIHNNVQYQSFLHNKNNMQCLNIKKK